MAQQDIIIGAENAKAGDTLFDAFTKVQANTTETYVEAAANAGNTTALDARVTVNEADIVALEGTTAGFETRIAKVEGSTPAAVAGGIFVSDGAGGGEFIRVQGWAQYVDADQTVGTPTMNIANGVRTLWLCDGGTTSISKPPSDALAPLWNVTTSTITPISLFDTYSARLSFKAENYAGTAPYIQLEIDIGGAQGVIVSQSISLIKGGNEQSVLKQLEFFSGSDFMANGGKIYLTYIGTGTCDIFDTDILIRRESKNYV